MFDEELERSQTFVENISFPINQLKNIFLSNIKMSSLCNTYYNGITRTG